MHTPNLSMRLQLQRYLLSCKVRCRRATHFLESRACRPQSRVLLSRLCLAKYTAAAFAANSCVAGADDGVTVLRKAVYGKCSLVLPSQMQPFPLLCLTLVRTIAVVALTRPPCHRLRRSPSSFQNLAYAFDRSRERRAAMAPRTQSALEAARQSLGASQLRMLGKWCRDTHGDHAIALREVIFAYPLP